MVLDKKSSPIVAYSCFNTSFDLNGYVVGRVKGIVHESGDEGGLANYVGGDGMRWNNIIYLVPLCSPKKTSLYLRRRWLTSAMLSLRAAAISNRICVVRGRAAGAWESCLEPLRHESLYTGDGLFQKGHHYCECGWRLRTGSKLSICPG